MNKLQKRTKSEYWKDPALLAAFVTLVAGLCIHLYGLVNTLHNYDDICVQPYGYGTSLTSGRWALYYLGEWAIEWFGSYNLPWFNGVLFILLMAIAVGLFVSALEIRSRTLAALTGLVFISFPSATSTLFFRYTVGYYGIAILCAVLAAWVLKKWKFGFVISAALIAISLGIYQAYLPLTAALLVLMLMKQTLEEDTGFWRLLLRGILYAGTLIAGLLLYFGMMHLSLEAEGVSLSNYQGVNDMGHLSLREMPLLVWKAIKDFCKLPISDYCDLAQLKIIKVIYGALGVFTVLLIGFLLIVKKKKVGSWIMSALLCCVYPVAVNLIVIMCPDSWIYTLMVYSFAVVPCTPLALLEAGRPLTDLAARIVGTGKKIVSVVVVVLVLAYSYLANVNYTALHYANRQTENYMNDMVTQIRMTDGFTSQMKWAFIGTNQDPLFRNTWQQAPIYGGNATAKRLTQAYSWNLWIQHYGGYAVPLADNTTCEQITQTEEFKEMPTWPDEGSIRVVDDIVVIKFSDTET